MNNDPRSVAIEGAMLTAGFSPKDASAIVHRVNTWDAMREALRDVLNDAGGRPKSCGHEYSCVCAWNKATAALAAADGEVGT